jgi:hypothetical protein
MTPEIFLKPRLVGARFEDHSIPLEILKDLAVLEEMVVEVAKWEFLQDHPNRRRVPRRFAEGIELRLMEIEEGSAILVIVLVAKMVLFPSQAQRYMERARDSIVSAIGVAEKGTAAITEHLPETVLGFFDRFGRGLRDGEAIEFPSATTQEPVRLTRETRRKLVLAATNAKAYSEEVWIRVAIPEMDQDDRTFEIQTPDGRKAKAPLESQHLATILEAFNGYRTGSRVTLRGIGRFSRQGRLEALESIEHASPLDSLDVPSRLDELRSLKDGWLDGRGKAPQLEGLDWLARVFEQHFSDDLRLPYLYPTAEGGIQAEWAAGKTEVSLEIDLERRSGEWHQVNLDTASEEARELQLSKSEAWTWLNDRLRELGGTLE